MRRAFKEWAIVIEALGSGDQILLLRKGGISEGRRGFQIEHSEFLLYPTGFHQHRNAVVPAWQDRFDSLQKEPTLESHLPLRYLAHVISWRRLESLASAENLRGQHIWRDEVISSRFDWGGEKNIYALAVRVFRLSTPVTIVTSPAYGGCKSWIELETDVSTDGATPVLSKEDFNSRLEAFHAALDKDNSGLSPGLGITPVTNS